MKNSKYNKIVQAIEHIHGKDDVQNELCRQFPDIDPATLRSIYSQFVQRNVRRNYYKITSTEEILKHYNKYFASINNGEESGILLRIANRLHFSPAMFAKTILEHHLSLSSEGSSKHQINKLLRDTTLIQDKHLSYEVYLCLLHDDVYGPLSDSIKHSIGHEYEFLLKKKLQELNIGFHDEVVLRNHGYDKTPDIKLDIPIAIEDQVINWIESKALFGDEENHKTYLKDQLWSYWNRFGPGMVIYWFGYVDEIDEFTNKGILVRDHLPQNITYMNP